MYSRLLFASPFIFKGKFALFHDVGNAEERGGSYGKQL